MPLYEYQCDDCGRAFELIRKFSDPPLEKCPHCGGKVRKLFSSPAIQFKGSGFYITDYAKKDQSSPSSSEAKDDAASSKEKGDATSKSDTEKTAKAEKTDTSQKSEKSEKGEKRGRGDSGEKTSKDSSTPAKTESPSPSKTPAKNST